MEHTVLDTSRRFWTAMEHANEAEMRAIADPACQFVHIGGTCGLEEELHAYTSGVFSPTEITLHKQDVRITGDTAIVITDCDYGLLLDGKPTSHHFTVTEVYQQRDAAWTLIQFSFTALVF